MPTPTYTPLANITLGSSAASVSFSSISQSYKDLVFVISGITSSNQNVRFQVNGLTTNIYSRIHMSGDGTSAASGTSTNDVAAMLTSGVDYATTTAGWQSRCDFMDYSTTNKHKIVLSRSGLASAATNAMATRIGTTSAITSVVFSPAAGTWSVGSTFTLYGIVA